MWPWVWMATTHRWAMPEGMISSRYSRWTSEIKSFSLAAGIWSSAARILNVLTVVLLPPHLINKIHEVSLIGPVE